MNANTANKIEDAIAQAIHCGESVEAVLLQVHRTLERAIQARADADLVLVRTRADKKA